MHDNFMKGCYGIFTHFLVKGNNKHLSSEDWNQLTKNYDAEGIARQAHEVGAKWLFFTMGQASGHYAAPNATFDRISDVSPSKCSKRDLPLALYEALKPYGIKLCLYMSSEAPNCPNFGWRFGRLPDGTLTGERLADFQLKWEAVITEWSERYGDKISAWWIDSCYFDDAMYNHPDRPNFKSFAAALRTGNPNAMLAFNSGIHIPVKSITDEDDYTPGELATSLPTAFDRFPITIQTKTGNIPIAESPIQYHLLCSLGRDWGHLVKTNEPRFPDALASAYTEYILNMGGAITWEVPIDERGVMPEPIMHQLRQIKKHMEAR